MAKRKINKCPKCGVGQIDKFKFIDLFGVGEFVSCGICGYMNRIK